MIVSPHIDFRVTYIETGSLNGRQSAPYFKVIVRCVCVWYECGVADGQHKSSRNASYGGKRAIS